MPLTYTQCELFRKGEKRVAWIPSKLSACKYLKIQRQDGWLVTRRYGTLYLDEIEATDFTRKHMKLAIGEGKD